LRGRPAKYNNQEELQAAIDSYFSKHEKPTITGLALFLGFESRQSLYDYEKNSDYSFIVKRARTMVEASYEEDLRSNNVAGVIFALKNMGWKDRTEVDNSHTIKGKPLISLDFGDIQENYKGD
jgi:hypothetical protein